jgi:choline dehydrogenase
MCVRRSIDEYLLMNRQILLLSGVGPSKQLEKHKIPVVVDLSGVGSNLVDHAGLRTSYEEKTKTLPLYALPRTLFQIFQLLWSVLQFLLTGNGWMITNVSLFRSIQFAISFEA